MFGLRAPQPQHLLHLVAPPCLAADAYTVFAQYREQGVLLWRGYSLEQFADQRKTVLMSGLCLKACSTRVRSACEVLIIDVVVILIVRNQIQLVHIHIVRIQIPAPRPVIVAAVLAAKLRFGAPAAAAPSAAAASGRGGFGAGRGLACRSRRLLIIQQALIVVRAGARERLGPPNAIA
ncbi:hypothetical protein TSOC_007316 [Tetrabaena socialis]|uniref:Uncharacterized protein n=1 Tax=Tetrabaena socialis TaxID=47790 RepID=A0A2J8A1A3_9CHLO|nr:hypothetical protein TSOC_007316 [Tetrabaena socialis]|eukprot:PNH06302.1 hypothetical protein TSOC_007316 [Tetrabaena socialis]